MFLSLFIYLLLNILNYFFFSRVNSSFIHNKKNLVAQCNFVSIIDSSNYNYRFWWLLFTLVPLNLILLFLFGNFLFYGDIIHIKIYQFVSSGFFVLKVGLLFDSLTYLMLFIVITISTAIHFYSLDYMLTDPHLPRFISYLSLFTVFMLILITADNFLSLFVGWEGVGLCSYLLINFWFTRIQANKAALKALIVNRIGDFGLILSNALIFYTFKSIDYNIVFSLIPYLENKTILFLNLEINIINLLSFLLLFSAIGKSAQIGLHIWLPDAMEGPTPVSALIHAATMVTAGVFLIIRSSPLFEYSSTVLISMMFIGSLTTFFAATTGLFQYDIKKVIAYSTCSQLGYMVFACGISNYSVSLYHLVNHAFFKALLFLSAGVIIHLLNDEQDMRKYGNLRSILPFVYMCFLIGNLSLIGFPFLSGFYSKDMILEICYEKYLIPAVFVYWLGSFSTLLTAFYSFRLMYLTFFNDTNLYKNYVKNLHNLSFLTILPLIFLLFFSIFSGYLLKEIFVGFGCNFFGNSIYILPQNKINFELEYIPIFIKFLPLFYSIIAVFIYMCFTSENIINLLNIYKIIDLNNINIRLHYSFWLKNFIFFFKKWYFDKIYNIINLNLLLLSYDVFVKILDKGIIEYLGPTGIVEAVYSHARKISLLHKGYIPFVLAVMLNTVLLVLVFIYIFIY